MRSIIMLVALAGRRLAADGVPFIDSRYARRVLVLSATLTAVMVVGLLGYATPSRADVDCNGDFCIEKTSTPDPVKVGEPLTFTISVFCVPGTTCSNPIQFSGVQDTLPTGLEFVSASVTGGRDPNARCVPLVVSTGILVDCSTVTFNQDTPFVATIEVIPKQCGTFPNTADFLGLSASETYTVLQCVPMTKDECKKGGSSNPALGWPDQGTCINAWNNKNRP